MCSDSLRCAVRISRLLSAGLAGDGLLGGGGVNCGVDSGASASRVFFSNDSGKGGGSGRRVRSGAMRNDACKVRAGGGEEKSSASATSRLKCRASESVRAMSRRCGMSRYCATNDAPLSERVGGVG